MGDLLYNLLGQNLQTCFLRMCNLGHMGTLIEGLLQF